MNNQTSLVLRFKYHNVYLIPKVYYKHLDSNVNHFFTHLYDLCFDVESNDGFSIIIPQKFLFFSNDMQKNLRCNI